jgi:hypothetical protein
MLQLATPCQSAFVKYPKGEMRNGIIATLKQAHLYGKGRDLLLPSRNS